MRALLGEEAHKPEAEKRADVDERVEEERRAQRANLNGTVAELCPRAGWYPRLPVEGFAVQVVPWSCDH